MKTSSRHVLQEVLKKSSTQQFFCFPKRLQALFKRKNNCLEHVFITILQDVLQRSLEDVLNTSSNASWETKNSYAENVLKWSSRHFLKTNKCLAGNNFILNSYIVYEINNRPHNSTNNLTRKKKSCFGTVKLRVNAGNSRFTCHD